MSTLPRRRERLTGSERREVLLREAADAFAELGYGATSVALIAQRSGVSKAIVYDHFDSKRAMYVHLLESEMGALFEQVARAVAPEETPERRLRLGVGAWFAFLEEHHFARRLMFQTTNVDPEIAEAHADLDRRSTAGIAAIVAEDPRLLPGEPRRDEALEIYAQMFKSALNGLAIWAAEHPEVSADALVEQVIALFLPAYRELAVPVDRGR